MKQLTLAAVGFERYAKTTRRAAFLAEMERVVPWSALCALIEPFYPKPGNGRPPVGVERMLRIYFLQQWFNLSDPAGEEGVLRFAGKAAFCEHRSRPRAGAGRDDGVPLPSPARNARSGPAAVRRSAAAPGGEGTESGDRHDCRCDDHQCAVFDQECRESARSRDAPDQEGQPVVFRLERAKNRTKSKVRARVEHAIGVIRRVFGFAKVHYRGLKKNTLRLLVTCALANLFMTRRHLLRCQGA